LLHTKTNFTPGIFTPSDELANEVTTASGEKFWRLPLEESYWDGLKSVADMVNTGG
jgi:leucyl aminopeptidase